MCIKNDTSNVLVENVVFKNGHGATIGSVPDGNGLHGFDPARIQSENITTVAFYCWTAPWQSEPAAIWFAQQYPDITVYDLKGLSYLDDIPGFWDGTAPSYGGAPNEYHGVEVRPPPP